MRGPELKTYFTSPEVEESGILLVQGLCRFVQQHSVIEVRLRAGFAAPGRLQHTPANSAAVTDGYDYPLEMDHF